MLEAWIQKTGLLKSKRDNLAGTLSHFEEGQTLLDRCTKYTQEKVSEQSNDSFLGTLALKTLELWIQDIFVKISAKKIDEEDSEHLLDLNSQLSKVTDLYFNDSDTAVSPKWLQLDNCIKDSIS